MLAFLPLISALAPSLVKWAVGEHAADVTTQVIDAAKEVFGTDDPQAIERAIAASPELAWKFKEKLLDIQDRQMQREHEQFLATLSDVQNARQREIATGDKLVGKLAIAVLLTFTGTSILTMTGCFLVLKYGLKVTDQNLAIAVSGLIGNITGYLAANAQQVLSYYFGSTRGSSDKTAALSDAVNQVTKVSLAKGDK